MLTVPSGWRPILSDDGATVALGNGFVRLLDVASELFLFAKVFVGIGNWQTDEYGEGWAVQGYRTIAAKRLGRKPDVIEFPEPTHWQEMPSLPASSARREGE